MPGSKPKTQPKRPAATAEEQAPENSKKPILMSQICPFLTQHQEELLREELTQFSEFEVEKYFAICSATRFNPYLRQIYATARRERSGETWINRLVPVVSIEGLRSLAAETNEYEGQTEPKWCNKDGKWADVWLAEGGYPYAAKVGVRRKGFPDALVSVARYDSFVQTISVKKGDKTETQPTSFWKKAPDNQLLKCAEAGALRKAFPQKLGGLYIAEEIRHDDEEPVTTTEEPPVATVPEVTAPARKTRSPGPVKAEKKPPVENPPVEEPEAAAPEEKKPAPVEEPEDPLFAETPSAAKTGSEPACLSHVMKCLTAEEFSGKTVGSFTIQQLERIKTHWIDKKMASWKDTPDDEKKKVEAKAILDTLAYRKAQQ